MKLKLQRWSPAGVLVLSLVSTSAKSSRWDGRSSVRDDPLQQCLQQLSVEWRKRGREALKV